MSVYVFGHKNPDSDTICSAIALADLKSKIGVACTPSAQGELPPRPNSSWKSSAWPPPQ